MKEGGGWLLVAASVTFSGPSVELLERPVVDSYALRDHLRHQPRRHLDMSGAASASN
jgi:hypothetical protein